MTSTTRISGYFETIGSDQGPFTAYRNYKKSVASGSNTLQPSKIPRFERVRLPIPVWAPPYKGAKRKNYPLSGFRKTTLVFTDAYLRSLTEPKKKYDEMHEYTLSIQQYNNGLASERNVLTDVTRTMNSQNYASAAFPGPYWNSNDDLALLSKLREKVAGSDFNLGIFLAEGKEALGMITNSASRIYKSIYAVKRGDFKSAARALTTGTDRYSQTRKRVTANNWLELQYGWLPLLKDAQSAAEFLAEKALRPRQFRVVARHTANFQNRFRAKSTTPAYSDFSTYRALQRGQIVARLSEIDEVKLIGLSDPLSIIWEKLPYSFVIDWFAPIGAYLSARGLSQALKGTFATTRYDWFGAYNWIDLKNPLVELAGFDTTFEESKNMVRSISSLLDVPLPSVKPLAKAASWRHCANAVALLTQLNTPATLVPKAL